MNLTEKLQAVEVNVKLTVNLRIDLGSPSRLCIFYFNRRFGDSDMTVE